MLALLEALGVDREVIMTDYLRSNDAVPQLRERIMKQLWGRLGEGVGPEALTFVEARLTDEVLGVTEDYLRTAWKSIDENYGGMDGYLRAAGVSEQEVSRLRAELR